MKQLFRRTCLTLGLVAAGYSTAAEPAPEPPVTQPDYARYYNLPPEGTTAGQPRQDGQPPEGNPPRPGQRPPNGPPPRPFGPPPSADQFFQRFDTNKDGTVTHDEFIQGHKNMPPGPPPMPSKAEMFMRLDKNGDGVLSREEFEALPMPPPPIGPPPPPGNLEELFKHLDTNADGNITREEYESVHKRGPPPPPPPQAGEPRGRPGPDEKAPKAEF